MSVRIFDEKELEAVRQVLDTGILSGLSGGKFTPRFEAEFAARTGVKRGVAMNCAMSVLHSSVIASGAGAGDEVICDPIVVFGAVAVLYQNAIPVFADVKPVTLNMDPESLRQRITERTKAVIVTHLCGLPAEMDAIMAIAKEHNLLVIEDSAHAILVKYRDKYVGAWGDVGSFSFQQSKHMTTGDGGMAVTNDDAIADKLALMAGRPTFFSVAHHLAWNYRMNEQTAAIGLMQLERVEGYVRGAQRNAQFYNNAVEGCPWIILQQGPEGAEHAYHIWCATFDGERHGVKLEDFRRVCQEEGAPAGGYTGMVAYEHPLIRDRLGYGMGCPLDCPLYKGTNNHYTRGLCPVAEDASRKLVFIGTYGPEDDHRAGAEKLRQVIERLS